MQGSVTVPVQSPGCGMQLPVGIRVAAQARGASFLASTMEVQTSLLERVDMLQCSMLLDNLGVAGACPACVAFLEVLHCTRACLSESLLILC